MPHNLILKPQEIPVSHPDSRYFFNTKPFVATTNSLNYFEIEDIVIYLIYLQRQAKIYNGLDYLQVFEDPSKTLPNLWFIDDGEGGATTALLPEDY